MGDWILTAWFVVNLVAYWVYGLGRRTITFTTASAIGATVTYPFLIWLVWR